MKVCKLCNEEKPLTEFYQNSGYRDGFSCRCKSCVALKAKESESKKTVEQNRLRHREKYHRLGYKDKQKVWDRDKPWKSESKYKNLSRNFKLPRGMEAHHWSYAEENLEDFITLPTPIHKQAHNFLVLDVDKRLFKTLSGDLLDTKEKHIKYLQAKGIEI